MVADPGPNAAIACLAGYFLLRFNTVPYSGAGDIAIQTTPYAVFVLADSYVNSSSDALFIAPLPAGQVGGLVMHTALFASASSAFTAGDSAIDWAIVYTILDLP